MQAPAGGDTRLYKVGRWWLVAGGGNVHRCHSRMLPGKDFRINSARTELNRKK